jgi:hypothetical protein
MQVTARFKAGAGRGNRTPKGRSPADFESAASASSAIPARERRPQVSTGQTPQSYFLSMRAAPQLTAARRRPSTLRSRVPHPGRRPCALSHSARTGLQSHLFSTGRLLTLQTRRSRESWPPKPAWARSFWFGGAPNETRPSRCPSSWRLRQGSGSQVGRRRSGNYL